MEMQAVCTCIFTVGTVELHTSAITSKLIISSACHSRHACVRGPPFDIRLGGGGESLDGCYCYGSHPIRGRAGEGGGKNNYYAHTKVKIFILFLNFQIIFRGYQDLL